MGEEAPPNLNVPDLRQSIDVLRNTTGQLNRILDGITSSVRALEAALEEWGVGMPAAVTVDGNMSLRYRKVKGQFRLTVVIDHGPTVQETAMPWSDCSRALKLRTVVKLPALIGEMGATLQSKVAEAESAAAIVRGVEDALAKGS